MADAPAEHQGLTLAFLSHAPGSAAQVLEEIEPQEAAAFLETVPARIAAPVVAQMSSWNAARCVALLEPARAAAVLQQLEFHDCAGIARLVAGSRRNGIFESLPGRLGRRLASALTYPAGSVGAWIDPEIPAFAQEAKVAEALRYLADAPVTSHVFLHADGDVTLAGAVPVGRLLRAAANRPLSELPRSRIRPLSSRAMLASVAYLAEWDDYLMLPVIGRNRVLVGGLTRAALRKGMAEHRTAREPAPGNMAGHVLAAFATTCAGLMRMAANVEPRPRDR